MDIADKRPPKPAKGLIQREMSLQHYELNRFLPSTDIAPFVENYWVVSWDLAEAEPYVQGNLPQPCQNIIINPNWRTGIFGVSSGKFIYKFNDRGRIFGVKFWPGAFHTFYGKPVSGLSDRHIPIHDVFDVDDEELELDLINMSDWSDMAQIVEDLLRSQSPELDSKSLKVREIVEYIDENKDIVSVSNLAEIFEQTPRALRRLFDNYIGMPPKWVIDRYRMLEAVDALNNNTNVSIIELANQLGYFDQAHFTKAFSKLVGYPPSRYNFS